ncbi:hypothetical protein FQA39_LY08153 [Lamprigera yunnana]|nr:hypothetical protein FQA39_LY08153 [Lamprigera yunnana]
MENARAYLKTPTMALQEVAAKKGWPFPEYNLIYTKEGTHLIEFHYEVKIASVIGLGVGTSKQTAKHEAARDALEELIVLHANAPDEDLFKLKYSEVTNTITINYVGKLNEMCIYRKIPLPIFVEIFKPGLCYSKEFTIECQNGSACTRATAGSKKQAKQLAAKEMIESLSSRNLHLTAACALENFCYY